MNLKILIAALSLCIAPGISADVVSPNRKISLSVSEDSLLSVAVMNGKDRELMRIDCGRITQEVPGSVSNHTVDYYMICGKRRHCHNEFSEVKYLLENSDTLSVRVYDDGIAWSGCRGCEVDLSGASHSWLQDWSDCYEGFYNKDRVVRPGSRYGYPALFEYGDRDVFLLLSESAVGADNAAASLYDSGRQGVYEIKPDGEEYPGWQTAVIGSLSDVVESTLINDNSPVNRLEDVGWIKPGVASWIYWAYNHGSNDFDIIRRYVDMACELSLPYVLIDAEWDEMKNGYSILDAVSYALRKGVKPMIWYNSSVGWINGAPGPKFRLNDPENREKEFAWCEENGIAGVKIDFFSGDTNLNIKYMLDLLECAARHRLLVNFHGVTIPRGWQRTYPNLVSMEAVYGAEWYNNVPTFTDNAARHNATLPFTRNVIGSMDYTPCAFTDSQHPHITTDAHELALTVLFESGIQHLADRPESFLAQPDEIRGFLSELPAAWDDTLLLGGYPGDYVVMARKNGNEWYICGINGNDAPREITIDTDRVPEVKNGRGMTLITDGPGKDKSWRISEIEKVPSSIIMKPRGGFIIRVK
ncbi:glycoside hydrolase family 97 protein [Duncaniella freteri]|uniref:glycoside hydrolase family 97 protein n=2 Tax=Duncaniella TaxID=2518495 RepID=UPI00136ABFAA|nr:glycoside hydrolase family 97 protein [Duncaniella freteri]NBJ09072.1 glycoside hydrolase family 97 protein [Alistipes sp. Z76]NCE71079.1 glycoside hydrolase family 97 protein [Muribaculaceae bacterium M3]